ncbi:hypothetical protein [Nostoc commune]|nr:hypothetical protein [Nostoc commune]
MPTPQQYWIIYFLEFPKPIVVDDFVAVLGILAIANNPYPHAN